MPRGNHRGPPFIHGTGTLNGLPWNDERLLVVPRWKGTQPVQPKEPQEKAGNLASW
jgi:hypothetical protein